MRYDLFISYSRKDNEDRAGNKRVSQLIDRIKSDFQTFAGRELKVFFDKDEILGMEDWRHRIWEGLKESRLLLACLSPAFLASKHCEWEFIEYLKHEIDHAVFGDGVAPVYFVQIPGWDEGGFEEQCAAWVAELRRRQHIDLQPWFHEGEDALRNAEVQDRMRMLSSQIRERVGRSERAEASLGNVDSHNFHFTGRTVEMRRLRETMAAGRVGVLTTVHGLGGVGKTALAVEYAHAFAHEYGGGRWQIRCEGLEDLRLAAASLQGVRGLSFEFTEEEKLDLDRQFERVLRELKKLADAGGPNRCLLILDNVDRPKLLEPAQTRRLPSGNWLHVLATTRLGEHDLFGAHQDRAFLPVDELPEADAVDLIRSYQPGAAFRGEKEEGAALEIVRLLGCFTLAVESAAVYLGQNRGNVSCAGFLARLKKEGLEGLDAATEASGEGVLHGEMRLGATLRPTLELLGEAEMLALEYASLLVADHAALPWLRTLVARKYPEMGQDVEPGYPDPWSSLLRRLMSLRLLQATGVKDAGGELLTVRMHRLVQELVRGRLAKDELATRQEAVDGLVRERVAVLEKTTRWGGARWELEPLSALAWIWADGSHQWASWLLNETAGFLYHLAEWLKAEPLMRRALEIDESSYGSDHPKVAIRLNNLAQLLQDTNRLSEAELLMRRALEIDESSYGSDHPKVAIRLNNLAQLLQDTNRLSEAEPLMRRALEIDESSYGSDHPKVAIQLNNLALLLKSTNRLSEAEPLMRRALEIAESSYGSDHPKVAIHLNNLAQLLQDTNRLSEAEPLMRRALEIAESSLGPDHPKVAIDLNNLASLLKSTNRLSEAEPMMRRALEIDESSFGKDHPKVAIDLNNLASLLQATDRLSEAEPLMRRALGIAESSFGKDHPKVAIRLNNLAQLLQATNRLSEAEPMMRRALEIDESSLGKDHPNVAIRLNNLAQLLKATNRLSEAEPLMRRALEMDESNFGMDHPRVAANLNNLASLLKATNRLSEAEPMMRRALEIDESSYGSDHPKVAIRLNNLAQLLQDTNRLREAEPLMRRALEIDESSYGSDHPKVAIRLNNLAQLLQDTNRLSEAEPLMRRALEIDESSFGKDHPDVAIHLNNLAQLLRAMNRLIEAEPLMRRAVDILFQS